MNTKVNKIVKLAAAGLFLVALAINVKVTLDDPFVMLSEQAIATGSGSSSNTGTVQVPQTNWKSDTVWINTEISSGVGLDAKPSWWVSGTWVAIRCCVTGTDMDLGCDFNIEDTKCAQWVTRPAH